MSALRGNLVLAIVSTLALAVVVIECDRQKAGRRLGANGGSSKFQSPCGNSEQVASKIGDCLDQVFDMVEGKVPEAKNDDDVQGICNRFNNTERCVRNIAKDCLTGLHKTAISSISSGTKRYRTQECKTPALRSRYMESSRCVIKTAKENADMYRNMTAIAQTIRDLPNATAEEKLIHICCLLQEMDRNIEHIFGRACPSQKQIILGIVHAMTDDARSTLCLNPKCQGNLRSVIPARLKQPNQNFIEPVVEVLFLLSTE